jgi:hypothetical protein
MHVEVFTSAQIGSDTEDLDIVARCETVQRPLLGSGMQTAT